MRRVLVLGATSTIARLLCQEFAREGDSLFLAGRDEEELRRQASDLQIRHGTEVRWGRLEAEDFASHEEFVVRATAEMSGLDGAVYAIGLLGDQPADSADPMQARRLADVNFTSAVTLLNAVAARLEPQRSGFILGLSSVAGERGRQSNYAYGAAKGGLSLFLQGLRNRLDSQGVRVYTIQLGVVDTAMTWGKSGLPLMAAPEPVARSVYRTLQKRSGIYYIPPVWRLVMTIIRWIPETIFKKLKL